MFSIWACHRTTDEYLNTPLHKCNFFKIKTIFLKYIIKSALQIKVLSSITVHTVVSHMHKETKESMYIKLKVYTKPDNKTDPFLNLNYLFH